MTTVQALQEAARALDESAALHKRLSAQHRRQAQKLRQAQADIEAELARVCGQLGIGYVTQPEEA